MAKQNAKQQNKVFVLDTNVLIQDPKAFLHMGEHDVVIPLEVITELDKLKSKNNSSVSVSARQVSANLDPYFGSDLYKNGVSLGPGKGNLSIFITRELHPEVKKMFREDSPDNRIISAAIFVAEKKTREINKKQKQQKKKVSQVSVIFVSNDNNLRFKAGALGITAESYRHDAVADVDSLYSGVTTIRLNDGVVSKLYQPNGLQYSLVEESLGTNAPIPHPFEFFVIKGDGEKNHLSYYDYDKGILYPVTDDYKKIYESVTARNDEQQLAMWALLNPKIRLVTLSGRAGTGKTMLAVAAAIRQERDFDKILLTKSIVGLSENELGFLPGDAKEKMKPYVQSLYDQIDFLNKAAHKTVGISDIDKMLSSGKIDIEPLPYVRGRSLMSTLLIVDEAQNLNRIEAQAFATRIHESSKIIFIGDLDQIDATYLNRGNNGLAITIDAFKDYDAAAHITLVKGERSRLAEWAATHM